MLVEKATGSSDRTAVPVRSGILNEAARAGQTVVLRASNAAPVAKLLIEAVYASVRVLVVSDGVNPHQIEGHAKAVNAHGLIYFDNGTAFFQAFRDVREAGTGKEPGIYILSSGSTGHPKTVFRPLHTWLAEGERYRNYLDLTSADRVLILSPISHAYGLGFLWGAHLAGAGVDLVEPTDMGAAIDRMTNWATYVCVTPNIAKLLAMRTRRPRRGGRLQVAMAGAGPITAELDQDFERAFGLRLSTNYGSTEAGGVFAARAPVEPGRIGSPMPGVSVIAPEGEGRPFALEIGVEGAGTHAMGDIVTCENGVYRVVGRQGRAIRRGERWVAPIEIEATLQAHDHVTDCKVEGVAGQGTGNDRICASVVLTAGSDLTPADLVHHCKDRLSAHEVPDRVDVVAHIDRNERGKVPTRATYRLGETANLVAALNGYKATHLLFALADSGILTAIEAGQPLTQISFERGLSADWLEQVLRVAEATGILSRETGADKSGASLDAIQSYLDLERANAAGLNRADMVAEALLAGSPAQTTQSAVWRDQIKEAYVRAMNGSHKDLARMRVARHLRKARIPQPVPPLSVLDVSATGGGYTRDLIARGIAGDDTVVILPVGLIPVDGFDHPHSTDWAALRAEDPADLFDLIVLDNALHHSSVVSHFDVLVSRLTPDGGIVVDDLFLSDGAGSLGVDWLTHGGLELLDEAALRRFAAAKGLSVSALQTEQRTGAHQLYWLQKTC